ncbi:MAG: FAD:protein FMN transferase, partial [Bacteroidota bacterium]
PLLKYGHEIDPVSGYPIQTTLLGVSVFAESCMLADAYATAFMIMGTEKSKAVVAETDGLEAIFIYGAEDGELAIDVTPGIASAVLK